MRERDSQHRERQSARCFTTRNPRCLPRNESKAARIPGPTLGRRGGQLLKIWKEKTSLRTLRVNTGSTSLNKPPRLRLRLMCLRGNCGTLWREKTFHWSRYWYWKGYKFWKGKKGLWYWISSVGHLLTECHRYLWPGYGEDSSNYHVLLIILIVNAKRRERVSTWGMCIFALSLCRRLALLTELLRRHICRPTRWFFRSLPPRAIHDAW